MLKRTFLFLLTTVALAFGMAGCDYARAQDALVVSVCGTLPLAYAPGATRPVTVDIHGQTCSAAPSPVANQAVDIQKVLGAAPSLTNPLWVFPATGATFPVSGTFWQATQPVSLATAPTTPVTGTFWQTTQPVSGTFYQATQPVSVAAAPLNAIGITPTDRTITSATGASQTLMAANAARHSLTVENTGNANCGVNPTGGTAAIGGAGTLTLVPNGSYQPRIPSVSAVTIICTSSQPIYGEEN